MLSRQAVCGSQCSPLSLVESQRVVACSSLVLYGIRDRWLPCTERSYYRRPYAICFPQHLNWRLENSVLFNDNCRETQVVRWSISTRTANTDRSASPASAPASAVRSGCTRHSPGWSPSSSGSKLTPGWLLSLEHNKYLHHLSL